ncbi:uncharacterized protein LODBEIA_P08360 [Lodderomyces beijingensis]|uniref:G-patch domain-containing protein n=1 Tax=Lodderomyces beijingensis TaxID=1775926 RepID=A0ABP0ZEN2_9ASCO
MGADAIFIPGPESMASVGQNMGRRKYGHLAQEASYTESHHQETLSSRTFRNRPMMFVKAKDVYDPNVILHKLTAQRKSGFDEIIDDEFRSISIEDSGDELGFADGTCKVSEEANWDPANEKSALNSSIDEKSEPLREELDIVVEEAEGLNQVTDKEAELLESAHEEVDSDHNDNDNDNDNDDQSEGSRLEDYFAGQNAQGFENGSTLEEWHEAEGTAGTELNENSVEDQPILNIDESVSGSDCSIHLVARDMTQPDDSEPSSESEEALEFSIDAPAWREEKVNFLAADDQDNDGDRDDDEDKVSDPEYGFLEEDFEFDASTMDVKNVRFGINNQYFIKCPQLTGLADGEYCWVDEEEVIEHVLENGVRDYRVPKFLSYITKGMIDNEQSPEPDEDVYISDDNDDDDDDDDDEEEVDNDELDSDRDDYPYDSDDHLEDLLEYSKTSTQGLISMSHNDFSRNKDVRKRTGFDDLDLDPEIESCLIHQLQTHNHNKKNKRKNRQEQQLNDAIFDNDILIKYPFKMSIKEIKSEFVDLLKDESRQTLSFPSFDTHAHHTIKKLAQCYNMQVIRCGPRGQRPYLKICKSKHTFKNHPNYDGVAAILRGRPIFHRIDAKPTKDPAHKTKTLKDRGNRDSKARFKEGDIVGAEAPEIGVNNLGRQMLERLGWSRGMGLGVTGRGINEPIVAKVKMSKTGIR